MAYIPPTSPPVSAGGENGAQANPKRLSLIALAGIAVALGGLPFFRRLLRSPDSPGLEFHASPRALAPLRFAGPNGDPTSLAAWRGRVVLLNIWATWCPPCVTEMPSLDRPQAALGGTRFEVIPLTLLVDPQGREIAQSRGAAQWDRPQTVDLLRFQINRFAAGPSQ